MGYILLATPSSCSTRTLGNHCKKMKILHLLTLTPSNQINNRRESSWYLLSDDNLRVIVEMY